MKNIPPELFLFPNIAPQQSRLSGFEIGIYFYNCNKIALFGLWIGLPIVHKLGKSVAKPDKPESMVTVLLLFQPNDTDICHYPNISANPGNPLCL